MRFKKYKVPVKLICLNKPTIEKLAELYYCTTREQLIVDVDTNLSEMESWLTLHYGFLIHTKQMIYPKHQPTWTEAYNYEIKYSKSIQERAINKINEPTTSGIIVSDMTTLYSSKFIFIDRDYARVTAFQRIIKELYKEHQLQVQLLSDVCNKLK